MKGTVVYKVEFGHYSSSLVLVYLVKQDHFDQTMLPYFFVKAIYIYKEKMAKQLF